MLHPKATFSQQASCSFSIPRKEGKEKGLKKSKKKKVLWDLSTHYPLCWVLQFSKKTPGKSPISRASLNAGISLLVLLTRSSGEVLSSRLLRAFSTRARRPDRDSRRLTTLSRSPINILNLSNSFGLQTSFTMASTSSPRILFAWMSSRSVSRASLSTCSFLLMLSISSCCGK